MLVCPCVVHLTLLFKVSSSLLRLVIRDLRPFSVAESPGFEAFLKDMQLAADKKQHIGGKNDFVVCECNPSHQGISSNPSWRKRI